MIHFSQKSPLPTDLNEEEALRCGSAYTYYHQHFRRAISEKLGEAEFDKLKLKARELKACFLRVGIAVNAEYGALLHKEMQKADHESYVPKIIVPAALGLVGLLSYVSFMTDLIAMGAVVCILGYWAYYITTTMNGFNAAFFRLDDLVRERKYLELELEKLNHLYKARSLSVEIFAKVQLLTNDYFDNSVYPGHIDQARQPRNLRPVPPLSDQQMTWHYGANFENVDDPRIPENISVVIWVKLLIASLPDDIADQIQERFSEDYGYYPVSYWDYGEFQREWKNGSITKLDD